MTAIGELALWTALVFSLWGATVGGAGASLGRPTLIASAERSLLATLGALVLAALGVWSALLRSDLRFTLVAAQTASNLPTLYKVSALWAGRPGSLLFAAFVLSACGWIALRADRRRRIALGQWLAPVLAGVTLLVVVLCLFSDPYGRVAWIPLEGRGMDPRLQSPSIALQAPALYLGYGGSTVVFAHLAAALAARRPADDWLALARPWAYVGWVLGGAGALLGMRAAYVEPAFARYWAWAPVQSMALLHWTAATALLHRIAMRQTSVTLGAWDVVLATTTFVVAVAGVAVTGGDLSAHVVASAEPSRPGPRAGLWLLPLLALVAAAIVAVLSARFRGASARGRRWGASIAHASVVVLLAASFGLAFRAQRDVTLAAGERSEAVDPFGRRWSFVSDGIYQTDELNRRVLGVSLMASREGRRVGLVRSELREYVDGRGRPTHAPAAEAGIVSTLLQDVYVVLVRVVGDPAQETAQVRLAFNPFVAWVWLGGAAVLIAGLLAAARARRT